MFGLTGWRSDSGPATGAFFQSTRKHPTAKATVSCKFCASGCGIKLLVFKAMFLITEILFIKNRVGMFCLQSSSDAVRRNRDHANKNRMSKPTVVMHLPLASVCSVWGLVLKFHVVGGRNTYNFIPHPAPHTTLMCICLFVLAH